MDQRLQGRLEKREEQGTLRSLKAFNGAADFFSNDYLGLARQSAIIDIAGSTGSRLISGTSDTMLEAEATIAQFFGVEAALMFNSGYDANLGFFSVVPQRDDTVLYDELIHASVRDGLRLGLAKNFSFSHNDVASLEERLKKCDGTVYVVIESIYSMDGDLAPIPVISSLCELYGAYLVVDEAHAGGVFGERGEGLVNYSEGEITVFARLITFGKAYGSHGACWLGSSDLMNFLTNFSRPLIYTTALPEGIFQHNANLLNSSSLNNLRKELYERIAYFRKAVSLPGMLSNAQSPIQVIELGDVQRTKKLADLLWREGIAVKPIYSPTVPQGRERIRLCMHAFNTFHELDHLIELLKAQKI